jgi:hypothetical protein
VSDDDDDIRTEFADALRRLGSMMAADPDVDRDAAAEVRRLGDEIDAPKPQRRKRERS